MPPGKILELRQHVGDVEFCARALSGRAKGTEDMCAIEVTPCKAIYIP